MKDKYFPYEMLYHIYINDCLNNNMSDESPLNKLACTDWIVLRHLEEKSTTGITSISNAEYEELTQARSFWRKSI